MQSFESPSAFYLGRRYDREAGEVLPEDILYDAKDLTTHAVCVGMTGSAARPGCACRSWRRRRSTAIPAILAIDPKGDLVEPAPDVPRACCAEDFEPVGGSERDGGAEGAFRRPTSMRPGRAELWKQGAGGVGGRARTRIARAAGSRPTLHGVHAGVERGARALTVLAERSTHPAEAVRGDDNDAMRERVVVDGVGASWAPVGLDDRPGCTSREHILLSDDSSIASEWRAGRDRSTSGDLIAARAAAPRSIQRLGVHRSRVQFYPGKERFKLAMSPQRALIASPVFSAVDARASRSTIDRLLYTAGRQAEGVDPVDRAPAPSDERMFFVTLVLNEAGDVDARAVGDELAAGA